MKKYNRKEAYGSGDPKIEARKKEENIDRTNQDSGTNNSTSLQ